MNNYPNVITNLNVNSRLNSIAREMDERGFILR